MAQTKNGAVKIAAKNAGISVDEYNLLVANGNKWCSGCKNWHIASEFGKDSTRHDGLASSCFAFRKTLYGRTYVPKERKPRVVGARVAEPRDGDKKQARGRANHLVKAGVLPRPNDKACTDCGHIWDEGERRHEMDHHEGYEPSNHDVVQIVCTTCHAKRHEKQHCKHGHELIGDNVGIRVNGNRFCKECRRKYDKGRRDATYWREYRAKKKARDQWLNSQRSLGLELQNQTAL